jgi:Na+-translocating ferredoxin:NAD+ oxidoreductase RnfA subunit
MSPFFLALFTFALWTVAGAEDPLSRERFFWGLALPMASGLFEWLLEGLRERLRLLRLPVAVEGAPILFWLAMLLALSFSAFRIF